MAKEEEEEKEEEREEEEEEPESDEKPVVERVVDVAEERSADAAAPSPDAAAPSPGADAAAASWPEDSMTESMILSISVTEGPSVNE